MFILNSFHLLQIAKKQCVIYVWYLLQHACVITHFLHVDLSSCFPVNFEIYKSKWNVNNYILSFNSCYFYCALSLSRFLFLTYCFTVSKLLCLCGFIFLLWVKSINNEIFLHNFTVPCWKCVLYMSEYYIQKWDIHTCT